MNPLEIAPPEHALAIVPQLSETERNGFRTLKTVLFAEDDDDLRFVMECCLSAMGYLVVACADAHLASAAFHSHTAIDLLLTDFEMPRRSGMELARELTAIRPSLPVMILTGTLLSSAVMQEIRERQWTYVSKPCHLAALESTMKAMLTTGLSASATTGPSASA